MHFFKAAEFSLMSLLHFNFDAYGSKNVTHTSMYINIDISCPFFRTAYHVPSHVSYHSFISYLGNYGSISLIIWGNKLIIADEVKDLTRDWIIKRSIFVWRIRISSVTYFAILQMGCFNNLAWLKKNSDTTNHRFMDETVCNLVNKQSPGKMLTSNFLLPEKNNRS